MSISLPATLREPIAAAKKETALASPAIPLYIYAVSLASFLTVIGILWDISWHVSIGRDKFLSPPHILIYLGAIFGGLFSGIQVLWNTFRGPESARNSLVRVWGVFYSPLGALFCIWGAIAMLTSAPFDDWWHGAYGLDVQILSPPHSLLGLGMLFLQFGACVCISKYLNTNEGETGRTAGDAASPTRLQAASGSRSLSVLRFLFITSAASLLCMIYTFGTVYLHNRGMRASLFYQVAALLTLLLLPALGRALRMKWGMTAIALGYFTIAAVTNWVLQIFPAEPKLGPILTHVTHFQPAHFPLLIVLPALAMDGVMQRVKSNDWVKAGLLSVLFVLLLLAVEYPFSGFLLESPGARNWFFGAESWYFGNSPDTPFRYKFRLHEIDPFPALAAGIGIAILIGLLAGRLSLRWGRWMQSIQR